MSITYFSFSYISQVSFSTLSIFLLSGKNGKSLWELNKVFGYCASASRKYSVLLFSSYFFN